MTEDQIYDRSITIVAARNHTIRYWCDKIIFAIDKGWLNNPINDRKIPLNQYGTSNRKEKR